MQNGRPLVSAVAGGLRLAGESYGDSALRVVASRVLSVTLEQARGVIEFEVRKHLLVPCNHHWPHS